MSTKKTRREFLKKTLYAGAGMWVVGNAGCAAFQMGPRPRRISPNEMMGIAGIGAGGKGSSDIEDASKGNNVVALCDVDDVSAAKTFEKFPQARKYRDFRKMLEEMDKQIDAVTISTPDHQHYVATITAMKMGKHVYTQKPLTHDVWEARMLTRAAKKYPVVTQMGNQGTAEDGLREAVEVVQSGAIGPVREVHVWTNRPIWPQGIKRPTDTPPVPATLDWDLWLGTAPYRPYHSAPSPKDPKKMEGTYNPFRWRGWWDFGTGALGDMACHTANMAFMACKLGYPTSIEAECSKDINDETYPTWSIIRYEFPARGKMPALRWTWYDGGASKPAKAVEAIRKLVPGKEIPGSGSIIVGDKGTLFSPNDYGAKCVLLPEEKFKGYKPPTPRLSRAHGKHCEEWLNACKGQGKTVSNFGYAGPLTETVVLGCVALKVGQKILWDGPNMKITNCPEANNYLRREYRKGWDTGYEI